MTLQSGGNKVKQHNEPPKAFLIKEFESWVKLQFHTKLKSSHKC